MSSRKPTTIALTGALCAALAIVGSCGGTRRVRDRPTPSLATTQDAANEIAEIQAMWRTPTLENRIELRRRLEHFLTRFPNDGATPLARVYLAFLHLDAGNLSAAEAHLQFITTLDPGATNDFAQVARAETMRVRGRPADALELLRPLAGKIVDRDARERFDEAIVRAALESRRDFEALAYMDAWLRNTEEHDRDAVRDRIKGAIARMPSSVLVAALGPMRRRDGASGYGRDIQKLVTSRVAEIAVEQDDAKLAQWLVDVDAGAVLSDETELLVSELATRQAGGTAFVGRTVGLVLPTSSSSLRDAAGDVARGMAWALEIPRTKPGAGDDTKLVTRDDSGKRGQLEAELEELAAEGAGVIVAGLDAESAERAVRWSEATGVPVITLAAPARAKPRASSFVIGEPVGAVLTVLADELTKRRETRIAIVAEARGLTEVAAALAARPTKLELFQPAPCEIENAQGAEARFPTEAWTKQKFRTWLVVGAESCARDLMREVGELDGALIALSLEATGRVERGISAHVISAAAGIVPLRIGDDERNQRTRAVARQPDRKRTDAGADSRTPVTDGADRASEVERYVSLLGSVPTWRSALGRDAGLLARQALRTLPLDTARSEEEVLRRREAVRRGILGVKDHFWTSEHRSLDSATRSLPRTVRVIEVR